MPICYLGLFITYFFYYLHADILYIYFLNENITYLLTYLLIPLGQVQRIGIRELTMWCLMSTHAT